MYVLSERGTNQSISSKSADVAQGSGDQKFTPQVDRHVLQTLASMSPKLKSLYQNFSHAILAIPPYSLGYPGETSQSSYYLGDENIQKSDIAEVSKVLEQNSIFPENTRIKKLDEKNEFHLLQASVGVGEVAQFSIPGRESTVKLVRGDYSTELERVCLELTEASKHASNDLQRGFVNKYIESFRNGSLDTYRDSLRLWVRDKAPRVENIFGFVEPYRDPHGIRAEFEALVAISDDEETKLLSQLVENSARFIRRLPWATSENDGKGPFEKNLFEPPDFSSIHSESLPLCINKTWNGAKMFHSACVLLQHYLSRHKRAECK